MTHSRAQHCKQWPIHQAELGESPTAWEGLLWEGAGGTDLCSEVLCPPPVAETFRNHLPGFTRPAHPATAISCFPQQSMGIWGHQAVPHVVAVVGSKATKASCQESPHQGRCPGRRSSSLWETSANHSLIPCRPRLQCRHTELHGSYIHLRKTEVLTSVSSLPKIPLLEMEEGNPQYLCIQNYKFGLAFAMPAISAWSCS